MKLSPAGYILVAADNIRVPVKAYSFSSNYAALPETYISVLQRELEVPLAVTTKSSTTDASDEGAKEANSSYWKFLQNLSESITKSVIKSYTPDTYLLTSQWGQSDPYNKLNPLVGDERAITGCTQTAIAQIMYYHEHPATGSGVFTQSWNGQTLTAGLNRPFNWDNMVDVGLSGDVHQQDEIAALMRDLGVLNDANYGVGGTSASFNRNDFKRAFGYDEIMSMYITNGMFFDTIRSELDALRPILLELPGHFTVADGYESDASGKSIHVNMGWNGSYDAFYVLDETIVTYYTFSPDHTIYYNIRPCESESCLDPYEPLGGGQTPVFQNSLNDTSLFGTDRIRIDGYDPDGDDISFSTSSSCIGLLASMESNVLALTVQEQDKFCRVRVQIADGDGMTTETFNVLTVENGYFIGASHKLTGMFEGQSDQQEFTVYLSGETTIGGTRGYSNQAFYLWVNNTDGALVIDGDEYEFTHAFSPGFYTVVASLKSLGSYSYPYNSDSADFVLSVVTEDVSVAGVADILGISLTLSAGDVNDDNTISLADTITALQLMTGSEPSSVNTSGDVDGDGLIGLAEAIFTLNSIANESN